MSEWKTVKLSSVIEVVGGGTPTRSKAEYWGGGIPWLSVADFNTDNRWVEDAEQKITALGLKNSSTRLLNEGDIIISARGTVGAIAQLRKKMAFNQSCYGIRGIRGLSRTSFIYYALKNEIKSLKQVAHGGVFDTITRDTFDLIEIRMPGIREQEKIEAILGDIDDKIALNRKLNETLEGMARALFQSWFVDFDPVKAKLAALRHGRNVEKACMAALSGKLRIRPGKPKPEILDDQLPTAEELDAAIAELDSLAAAQLESLSQTASHFPSDFQHSELGLIPQGWKIGTLNDFSTLNSSSWTTRRHPEVVHYIDLANCKNGYVLAANEFNWRDAPSRARRILKRGDTIIGTVRPGNRSFALIGDSQVQLTGSTGFAVLTPLKPYFREFIYLHSCGDENIARLTHLADGGAYPAVRPDVVSAYEVICPPEGLLCVFSSRISDCFDQINLNEHQSRTLAELRDTLLPKLLSGELKV